jgi:serine/threonine protein kinase
MVSNVDNEENKKQIGGIKLGQGSFGCVIKPPVECKNRVLRPNKYEINDEYISKIINTRYNQNAFIELNLGKKLTTIDKKHKYFLPFINACYFTPQKHDSIVYVSPEGVDYSDPNDSLMDKESSHKDGSSISTLNKGSSKIPSHILTKNRNKCILSLNNEYINLIGIAGGDNLNTFITSEKANYKINFINKNFRYVFSYLVYGLFLLHSNNIIHKDIKPANIIIDFDYINKNKLEVFKKIKHHKEAVISCMLRYIDFGLSINLNKRKYNSNEIEELLANGTHYYIPLEIFAIKLIYKLIKRGYEPIDKGFIELLTNKIYKSYHRNKDYYHFEGIRHSYFKSKKHIHSVKKTHKKIIDNQHIQDNASQNTYYLNQSKLEMTVKNIYELYKNNKLENNITSFMYGWDVYSLGITLAKIYIKTNVVDLDYKNLIFKMIEIDFNKRISVQDLLKTPKFHENLENFNLVF